MKYRFMKYRFMNKIVLAALVGGMAAALAACGDAGKAEDNGKADAAVQDAQTDVIDAADASNLAGHYELNGFDGWSLDLNDSGLAYTEQKGYYRLEPNDAGAMCLFLAETEDREAETQYEIELGMDSYVLTGYMDGKVVEGSDMELIYRGDEDQVDGLASGVTDNFFGWYGFAEDEHCYLGFHEDGTYQTHVEWDYSVNEAEATISFGGADYKYGVEDGTLILYSEENEFMRWSKTE